MEKGQKPRALVYGVCCTLLFVLAQAAAGALGTVATTISMMWTALRVPGGSAPDPALVLERVLSHGMLFTILGNGLFLAGALLVASIRHRPLSLKAPRPGSGACAAAAAAVACFSAALNIALQLLPGLARLAGNAGVVDAAARSGPWLYLALMLLAAPLTEEVAFRGMILPRLRGAFSAPIAMVLDALLFALCHMGTGGALTGLYAFLGGLLFALAYEKTGSLPFSVLLHALGNLCAFAGLLAAILPQAVLWGLVLLLLPGAALAAWRLARCPSGPGAPAGGPVQ